MLNGKYIETNSKIHNLNPTIKLVSFLLFLILIWYIKDITIQLFLTTFIILLLLLTHIPIIYYIKQIFKMKYLLISITILGIICNYDILVIDLEIINLISLSSYLLYTTKNRDLTYALEKVLSPLKLLKIPVKTMTIMISLSIQFIPNMFLELEKILKSLSSRGLDYRYTSKKEKWQVIKYSINPMFIYTIKNSDTLSDIMVLRGYQVNQKRTSYKNYSLKQFDYIYLIFHILLCVTIFVSEVL